jgi:hypothetical protein
VSRGRVPIAESALATLIETGSAYYSETSYHQEGETRLKSLAFMVAVEPVKTAGAKVIAFINMERDPGSDPG